MYERERETNTIAVYLGDGEDDSASGLVTDVSVGPGSWHFPVLWQHAAVKQSCLQEMIQN